MEEIKNTNLGEEVSEEQEIAQKANEVKADEKKAKKVSLLNAGIALMFATSALSLGVSCYQIFSKDKNDNSDVKSHENIGSVNYGQNSVTISEDGYWVINGTKTNVKAEAQNGENGADGEDGEDAPYVVDARIIPLDKWNITSSIVFTMSDGSYVTTNTQTQVLNGHYYEAENATDLVKLVDNFGVEKVRLSGNVTLIRTLDFEKNVDIDLNGKTLTYTAANPLVVEAGCRLNLTNGTVDFQTDKAIVLEGNGSSVAFDGVNIKANSTVVEALGSNASIKLANSTLTTVAPEVDTYSTSTAVESLFVIKGANANIEVKGAKIKTSKVIVAATEDAESFSLKLETTEVDTTTNILSVNTDEVVPTIVVDDATIEAMDESVVLNDTPITNGNFNFDLPSEMLGEGTRTFSVNDSWVVAEDIVDLVSKVEEGSTINLTENIELETSIRVDKKLTIDLCGYTIRRVAGTNTQTILVLAGGDLTIEDSMRWEEYYDPENGQPYPYQVPGGVDGSGYGSTSIAVWAYGGKVTINGGFFTNSALNGDNAYEVLYASNGGSLVINSGYFMGANAEWLMNIYDADRRAGTSTIVVNGGEFLGFNPANCIVEGKGTNFVSDGNMVYSYDAGDDMGTVYVVESVENLVEVAQYYMPNEITLYGDVELTEPLYIYSELTLDLNGHKLFNTTDIWNTANKDWSLISVRGGNLTIKNGTLEAKANDCYAIDVRSGSLTIESGSYLGNISAIYILEGNVTINGGTFDVVQPSEFSDKRYLVNCLDDSYRTGSAVVTINGGSFVGFNPVNNLAEGANTNFIADGHAVVENDGAYTVVEADGTVYASNEEKLNAALADETATTIVVVKDIDLTNTVKITREVTIDLNGHKLFNTTDIWNTANKDWSLISVRGGNLTIKNGTLEAKANDCYAIDVRSGSLTIESGSYLGNISAIYILEGNVTINGGTFDVVQPSEFSDKRYLVNCLDDSYRTGSAVVTINGGSFVGFNPVNNLAEGANTNFGTEGYEVVENNGVYTVVAE